MVTKIEAAKIAVKSGCAVFVGSGSSPTLLSAILRGESPGTFFAPAGLGLNERKKWLAFFPEPAGTLVIDDGACQAILEDGRSLLATGLVSVQGEIAAADVVAIDNGAGETIARGICRFSTEELARVQGRNTLEILDLYPGRTRAEVVHRDHLAPLR